MIDKRPLENRFLSFKAKGLLAYLLAKPDNWHIWTNQLIKTSTDRRRSILSALRELERAGHAKLEAFRHNNGRLNGRAWTIYEQPIPPTKRKQRAIEKHKKALSTNTENAVSPNIAKRAPNNNDSVLIKNGAGFADPELNGLSRAERYKAREIRVKLPKSSKVELPHPRENIVRLTNVKKSIGRCSPAARSRKQCGINLCDV